MSALTRELAELRAQDAAQQRRTLSHSDAIQTIAMCLESAEGRVIRPVLAIDLARLIVTALDGLTIGEGRE